MSDPGQVRGLLGATGWADVQLEPVDGESWFGSDVEDASSILHGMFAAQLAALGASEREDAVARLHHTLAAHARPAGVRYGSAAWLVTAIRPAIGGRTRERRSPAPVPGPGRLRDVDAGHEAAREASVAALDVRPADEAADRALRTLW